MENYVAHNKQGNISILKWIGLDIMDKRTLHRFSMHFYINIYKWFYGADHFTRSRLNLVAWDVLLKCGINENNGKYQTTEAGSRWNISCKAPRSTKIKVYGFPFNNNYLIVGDKRQLLRQVLKMIYQKQLL